MFTKDSRNETFLSQMGVEYSYSNNVNYPNLNPVWEITNLSRPVPIRDEAVLEYSLLMESGSPAPAPILWLNESDGKLHVLDGVQRLSAAYLIGTTTFSAYIVKCDSPDILACIRVLANARLQGRPEPPEWTRKQAVKILVVERGLTASEVARMGGWKPSQVESTARTLAWDEKIIAIGGPSLSDSMIEMISRQTTKSELVDCHEPISSFLNLIKQAKLSTADATPYAKEFFRKIAKESKRHAVYIDRLSEFKSYPEVEVRIKGRKGAGMNKDIQLRRSMRTTITVLDEMLGDCQNTGYVDEFFKLHKDIERRLKKLAHHSPAPSIARVPADKWSTNHE